MVPELAPLLSELFAELNRSGDQAFFHPHPLTEGEANRLAQLVGRDLYYIAVADSTCVGYGFLRGWDAGYEIPSLGIAIHPGYQGLGIGRALMHFLHAAAKLRGARRIRLKVYPQNTRAVRLYEELGYRFDRSRENEQLVGYLDL